MKKILIIGGTGSWGQELTKQLISIYSPKEIIIYSRGEHKQVEMARKFNNDILKFIIGDVRDKQKLKQAAFSVDTIFHMAALKHVPICERNPDEAVKINILGTMNAIDVAVELGVKNFIFVSTDKAVDPINVYGVSKSMAEKLVVNASIKNTNTKFVCIRGGNVIGTNGSVVPLFVKQIQEVNQITITDKEMTRFFMKLKDAISLIFKAVKDSIGGEIFVMKMPSVRIYSLANVMIKYLGSKSTKIKFIGKRPGEKIHEVLVSRYEATRTYSYVKYYVILPNLPIKDYSKWIKSNNILNREYNSYDNEYLSDEEIMQLLNEEGWLTPYRLVKELEGYTKEELIKYFERERWKIK